MIRSVSLLPLLLLLAAPAWCQDDAPAPQDAEVVEAAAPAPARTAERAAVKELLKAHKAACKTKDAATIAGSLETLIGYDNADFLKPAKAAFAYKPSRADQAWAKQEAALTGFEDDADEIARLLQVRRSLVEVAAAKVLAYQDPRKVERILIAAFEDTDLRTHRPASATAILEVFLRHETEAATEAVVAELNELRSVDMAKACITFLVRSETKSEAAWLCLCDLLRGPAPANVDDPTNPPASYWEARWKVWSPIRRDVQAALEKLTGRVWKADEGSQLGDAEAARRWVSDNAKKLGLR